MEATTGQGRGGAIRKFSVNRSKEGTWNGDQNVMRIKICTETVHLCCLWGVWASVGGEAGDRFSHMQPVNLSLGVAPRRLINYPGEVEISMSY